MSGVSWTCSSLCLLTDVRTVKKNTHWQFSISKHTVACFLKHFLGAGRPENQVCVSHIQIHRQAVLFHCKVNAENTGFFYCTESTCWDGQIFVEVSGWLKRYIFGEETPLNRLHPAEVLWLSTPAQLLCCLRENCLLPHGPPKAGQRSVLGRFILFSPRSNQKIWIRTKTFLRSLLGPADADHSQTHHNSQEPLNRLLPLKDTSADGGTHRRRWPLLWSARNQSGILSCTSVTHVNTASQDRLQD